METKSRLRSAPPDGRPRENRLRQQGIGISPFPVSSFGGKPGAPPPPLRYGSVTAPAQSKRSSACWAGTDGTSLTVGCAPRLPASARSFRNLWSAHQTGALRSQTQNRKEDLAAGHFAPASRLILR
jgi:hypothetical protein